MRILLFIFPAILFGQKNTFFVSAGGGTSSLQGFALFSAFTFETKHNEFTLRYNYYNQTGNKVYLPSQYVSYFAPPADRYNDYFGETAFLYGRTVRHKEWFFVSVSLGPAYFKFTDKTFVDGLACYNCPGRAHIDTKVSTGLGLASQANILFIFNQDFGMSLNFLGNLNGTKSIGGITLSFVVGRLNNE